MKSISDGDKTDDGLRQNDLEHQSQPTEPKTNRWVFVHLGIFILSFFLALESQVTFTFNPYITSDLHSHSKLSTVLIIVSIVASISKSPIAKLSDVFPRLVVLLACLTAFVLGEVCVATSRNVVSYIASQVLYALGSSGTPVVIQIIIADTSTLQNRVILSILPLTPYLVSAYLGPWLGEHLLKGAGWRWGLGLFAILVPVFGLPLILTLSGLCRCLRGPISPSLNAVDEHQEEDDSLVKREISKSQLALTSQCEITDVESKERGWVHRLRRNLQYYLMELDIIGILLMITSIPCLLVPATLTSGKLADWMSPKIYAPMIFGAILTLVMIIYEYKFARNPVIPLKLLVSNRVVAAGCLAATLYFMAYCIFEVYVTSFYQVARYASPAQAGYILNIYDWTSTTAAVMAGLVIKFKRHVRFFLITGALCEFVGYLFLSICFAKDAPLVLIGLSVALVSLGGGFFMWPTQLSVQSESSRSDLGSVTGLYMTGTTMGYSIGSSIAGALWSRFLTSNLQRAGFDEDRIKQITSNMQNAIATPRGSIERDEINHAYTRTMSVLVFVACGIATVATLVSLFVRCDKLDREKSMKEESSISNTCDQQHLETELLARSDFRGPYDEVKDDQFSRPSYDEQEMVHLGMPGHPELEERSIDALFNRSQSHHIIEGP